MTVPPQTTRRRFCCALGGMAFLGACGGSRGADFRPRDAAARQRSVALLVPLSGPRAPLGQKMARAVWLSEDLGGTGPRARVLDTGTGADTAREAAVRAVAEGADIIVGPLFRDQTATVAAAAGDVPVLSLSNDNELAALGAWVFGVTPAQSVEAVLRYSRQAGARRIAVLETADAIGVPARAALNANARKARISVLPNVPGNTSPEAMGTALRAAGGGTLPDILYVPSATSSALEQAVAAVGTGVTTIGSLQWSGLPAPQFSRLEKACFTGPDPQRFDRLSATFQAQLGEDMGVLGALAVDAVAFAKTARAPARLDRAKPMEGLLGSTDFRSDRTCARALSVLRISGGGVVRVA